MKHVADDSLDFCAVGFTKASGHFVDSGTVNLTNATELDSLTGANMSDSLQGGSGTAEPPHSTPMVGDVSADIIEQFASAPDAQDPIEQFSFGAEVSLDNAIHGSESSLKGVACTDGNDCNSVGSSVIFQQQESGALNRLVEDDGFISNCADVESVAESILHTAAESAGFDHSAIQTAFAQSLEPHVPKFMWEQDNFLNLVFGKDDVVNNLFPHVDMKRPHGALIDLTGVDDYEPPISKALRRGTGRPVYLRVFKQTTIVHEETLRSNFINGWTSIALLNVDAFSAFDKARLECADAELRPTVHLTVAECLARKATSTIGKRLGSMRRFAEYCTAHSLRPFPLEDSNMHSYMSSLMADANCAGSTGKAFIEAVRFTSAMLGLKSDELETISRRVAGLADLLIKRAPVVEQADPLTVEQIKMLERACCSAESLQDQTILGGILIMVFGSARASDMSRAVKVLIDMDPRQDLERPDGEPEGYIELGVLKNKGARSDVHRRLLLPIVCPLVSLSRAKWWESWQEARMALGLNSTGLLNLPVMCRFDGDGCGIDQTMTASEIGEFLRQALNVETTRRNKTRSHSCKSTILSWLAKYGTELPLRRLIGHHLDPSAKSAEIYARDSMAPAVREVTKILNCSKAGTFSPDDTRSGRFRVPPAACNEDADASEASYELPCSEPELAGDSDATGTDSSSDAGSEDFEISDSTTLWELLKPEFRPHLVQVNSQLEKFVHKVSCVVHLRKPEAKRFLCGHVLNSRYEPREQGQGPSAECPRCTPCFSSKDA